MKDAMYDLLLKQLQSLLEDEHDMIANLSNASALLFQTLPDINWAGFYFYKHDELILGPFQGKPACMHIPMGKGVCGSSAKQRQTLCIENVHDFPGHIACDSASKSEIVIPLLKNEQLLGVLDIDSPYEKRFDAMDQHYLEAFAELLLTTLDE